MGNHGRNKNFSQISNDISMLFVVYHSQIYLLLQPIQDLSHSICTLHSFKYPRYRCIEVVSNMKQVVDKFFGQQILFDFVGTSHRSMKLRQI